MNPNVEVLYMSGYTDNVVVDNATLYPGVDFLQKPFQPKTLIRKIRSLLDRPASEEEASV
jgi:FixJ family two-component response regulator